MHHVLPQGLPSTGPQIQTIQALHNLHLLPISDDRYNQTKNRFMHFSWPEGQLEQYASYLTDMIIFHHPEFFIPINEKKTTNHDSILKRRRNIAYSGSFRH